MATVKAWAVLEPKGKLQPFTYETGPLAPEQVEIKVEHCGICHTDLGFIANDVGLTTFPLVPGHEITGTIVAMGDVAATKGLSIGQEVGVGWFISSCGHCDPCLNGDQNLCLNSQAAIWGNHGGWAEKIRANWIWTIPIPDGLDTRDAGPLMCAGITVFAPLMELDIKPTDNIGVIGIGGLGHLAVQFAAAWGAKVTAFSNSPEKAGEIKRLGATDVVSSRDTASWAPLAGKFDLIIVTVGVPLDWDKIIALLAPNGKLHIVGILAEPIPVSVLLLLIGQRSLSSSLAGSRGVMNKMLRFAAQYHIAPITEHFPMSKVNEAIQKIESGKAAYRVVLDADF
jgi:alcohol/geraniol dehydrogenase (NADP+)